MSKSTKIHGNKKRLIQAMEKALGNVTQACRIADLDRKTYYNYYNSDPEFAAACDESGEIALDFVESKLFQWIKDDQVAAGIFYLKTKGRKRGYQEKQPQAQEGEPMAPPSIIINMPDDLKIQ